MKKILSKMGMSLMEILVGSLMLALILMAVTSVVAPMMMAFYRANDFAEYNTLLDNVGNRIVSDMAQASSVTFAGGNLILTINSEDVTYNTSPEGLLLRNDVLVFSDGLFRGKRIGINVEEINVPDTPRHFLLTVTVLSANRPGASAADVSRDYAVRPLLVS